MGVIYDYFSAPSDEAAASTIDRVGGPGSQSVLLPAAEPPAGPAPVKRGLFGRRQPTPTPVPQPQFGTDTSLVVFDTVAGAGFDPVVQLGTLEELLDRVASTTKSSLLRAPQTSWHPGTVASASS